MNKQKRKFEAAARELVLGAGIGKLDRHADVFEAVRRQLELRGAEVPPMGTHLSVAEVIALLHQHNGSISQRKLAHVSRRFQDHLDEGRHHCAFRSLVRQMRRTVIAATVPNPGAAQHAH